MPAAVPLQLTGTWLPGDDRGWVEYRHGWRPADERRRDYATARMSEDACLLGPAQRKLVETTVQTHCELKGWELFAVNCRSNHIHVVVAAALKPKRIRSQLKAWCTRRLKEHEAVRGVPPPEVRENWWAERGSGRYLNDQISLEAAIEYVLEGQEGVRFASNGSVLSRGIPH